MAHTTPYHHPSLLVPARAFSLLPARTHPRHTDRTEKRGSAKGANGEKNTVKKNTPARDRGAGRTLHVHQVVDARLEVLGQGPAFVHISADLADLT